MEGLVSVSIGREVIESGDSQTLLKTVVSIREEEGGVRKMFRKEKRSLTL